jgi:hypothetical protein
MKSLTIIISLTLVCSLQSYSQVNNKWNKWNWLLGDWTGVGKGNPGEGVGTFSFTTDLDSNILVRKSHSEYPDRASAKTLIHNDLMIVYSDKAGIPSKAIYFDNEGHSINYSITYHDHSITLLSEEIQGMPIFRLTYTLIEDGKMNTRFEMSQDGKLFFTYIEGLSSRIK